MHGRLKVRSTEEQKLIKEKEQQKKLLAYQHGMERILSTRKEEPYNKVSFDICAQLLSLNPDIYTLWNYRKEVISKEIKNCDSANTEQQESLITFLENELKLTELCLLANQKSYGSWHHRYWVLENHVKPNWNREFELCKKYLTMDDRNFHCWDYRRLVINKVGVTLEAELNFSTDRIDDNFSNYSSWHYRSTLRELDHTTIDAELELVQNAVFTDPADSSAWFYLRWVFSNEAVTERHRAQMLEDLEELLQFEPDCKWIYMAKCWLTGSLSLSDKASIETIEVYKKLKELDPLRAGQYEDYIKHSEEKQ